MAAAAACRATPIAHGAGGPIGDAKELVVGVTDDWAATHVTLRRYRWQASKWVAEGRAWQGVVGKTGLAWGAGLHGSGAPAGRGGPVKREGDGASPAGVFALGGAYGYAKDGPSGGLLKYQHVDDNWQCVDDPKSAQYTRVLDRRAVPAVDWTSHEDMKRADALYTWVIDVKHNPAHVPGGGSCIFLHVWSGPDSTTVGCTAMPEPELAMLVGTLDATAVFVLLPKAEYAALAAPWHLPAL